MSALPDIARLQPTDECLNVILKNTHFSDEILAADSNVQIQIKYVMDLPLLIFKFPEPYYDFLEILQSHIIGGTNQEWISRESIVIQLVLSDNVLTDKLTKKQFTLTTSESLLLRKHLILQKEIPPSVVQEAREYVNFNLNKLLG